MRRKTKRTGCDTTVLESVMSSKIPNMARERKLRQIKTEVLKRWGEDKLPVPKEKIKSIVFKVKGE